MMKLYYNIESRIEYCSIKEVHDALKKILGHVQRLIEISIQVKAGVHTEGAYSNEDYREKIPKIQVACVSQTTLSRM